MNLNSMQPILEKETKRRSAILAHQVDRHTPIRQAAEAIGRRNIATTKARTLTTAVLAFVDQLYDRNEYGAWWNIDPADGRILIACPWGRAGHRLWGLRRGEGDILRMLAMHWQQADSTPFVYSPTVRQWYLDISQYRTPVDVVQWLERHPIDATTWGILHAEYVAKLQERVRGGSRGGSRLRSPR